MHLLKRTWKEWRKKPRGHPRSLFATPGALAVREHRQRQEPVPTATQRQADFLTSPPPRVFAYPLGANTKSAQFLVTDYPALCLVSGVLLAVFTACVASLRATLSHRYGERVERGEVVDITAEQLTAVGFTPAAAGPPPRKLLCRLRCLQALSAARAKAPGYR